MAAVPLPGACEVSPPGAAVSSDAAPFTPPVEAPDDEPFVEDPAVLWAELEVAGSVSSPDVSSSDEHPRAAAAANTLIEKMERVMLVANAQPAAN